MADNVTEEAKNVAEKGKEKLSGNGNRNGGGSDLAKKLLLPAAAGVGTVAVTYAARKAPELVREQLLPKLEDRSSDEAAEIGKKTVDKMKDSGGVAGKVMGAASKLGGGGDGGGGKKTRRLPIQRWTDVAVPVEKAYEAWMDFEKYPQYMHRVLSVEKKGTNRVTWREKIWFSTREWEGEITDQRKNDRVAWKTKSGTQHTGVVSFHELDDNLTRVMVTVNFEPTGMFEKMASGLRFVKRAVQADLARFKAYVELQDAKGLEYSSTRDDDDEKDEKDDDKNDDTSRAESNGDSKSDEEAEEARQQRAERRESRKT